jgi:glycosyltransferase involved in cell wall biosynthesis
MKPLFSVVIPTFNSREFIVECVRSALEQTYESVEVIIDDNTSHDGTIELLQQTFGNHPRLKIFANEEDLNIPHGWNRGMKRASGKYLLLLHSDNLLHPRYAEMAVAALEKYSAPVAYSECHYFEGQTPEHLFDDSLTFEKLRHAFFCGGARAVDYVFRYQRMIPTSGLTISRSCFETRDPFDPNFTWDPDIELMTWLASHFAIVHLEAPLAGIRSHGGQVASWKKPAFSGQYKQLLLLANTEGRSEKHHFLVNWAWSNQDICQKLSSVGNVSARSYFFYLWRWLRAEIQLLGHFVEYFLRKLRLMARFTLGWLKANVLVRVPRTQKFENA